MLVLVLTGSEVSWLRLRLSVSSWVHWSMQRDSSVIWLPLRLSLFRLPNVYRHSGTRLRSLQERSTSGRTQQRETARRGEWV